MCGCVEENINIKSTSLVINLVYNETCKPTCTINQSLIFAGDLTAGEQNYMVKVRLRKEPTYTSLL